MKKKLLAVLAATALALGATVGVAEPASACSLHVLYKLYPYADDYPYTTTSYAGYRYFVTHNLGTASYSWVC